jgi:hypothetical protein
MVWAMGGKKEVAIVVCECEVDGGWEEWDAATVEKGDACVDVPGQWVTVFHDVYR